MPQISRKRLPRDIELRIFESFNQAIKLVNNDQEVKVFIFDLLTPTERVMLPKRLAIAILIDKGWSIEMICSRLNVTGSTVSAVWRTYERSNGFKVVIRKLRKSEAWRSLWQDIESLLYRFSAPGRGFLEEEAIRGKLGHKKKTLV